VLDSMRFRMTVGGRPVRLTRAVEPKWREHLFGPFGFRFQIIVKVRARPRGRLLPLLLFVCLFDRCCWRVDQLMLVSFGRLMPS
jgi:hypothetical protein